MGNPGFVNGSSMLGGLYGHDAASSSSFPNSYHLDQVSTTFVEHDTRQEHGTFQQSSASANAYLRGKKRGRAPDVIEFGGTDASNAQSMNAATKQQKLSTAIDDDTRHFLADDVDKLSAQDANENDDSCKNLDHVQKQFESANASSRGKKRERSPDEIGFGVTDATNERTVFKGSKRQKLSKVSQNAPGYDIEDHAGQFDVPSGDYAGGYNFPRGYHAGGFTKQWSNYNPAFNPYVLNWVGIPNTFQSIDGPVQHAGVLSYETEGRQSVADRVGTIGNQYAHDFHLAANPYRHDALRNVHNFCRNIHPGEGPYLLMRGTPEALDKIDAHLAQDKEVRYTQQGDLIDALVISLAALQNEKLKDIATVGCLRKSIRESPLYEKTVLQLHPEVIDRKTSSSFFKDFNCTEEQAMILLHMIGIIVGEVFDLVIVSLDLSKANSNSTEYHIRLRRSLCNRGATKIVFVYRESDWNDRTSWYGISTKPSRDSTVDRPLQIEGTKNPPLAAVAQPKQRNDASIANAPPSHSTLPFEFMDGITSEELITFFPNHCMHYPAISVRLIEDGWGYVDIERKIAEARGSENKVCANTLRHSMTVSCREFYGDSSWDLKSVTKRKDTPLVEKFADTPWIPKTYRGSKVKTTQPWTLQQIGEQFRDREGGIPGKGRFHERVSDALHWGLDSNKPTNQALQEEFNPPSLPPGWKPGNPTKGELQRQERKREKEEAKKQGIIENPVKLSANLKKGQHPDSKMRDEVLAKTDHNAEEVIRLFPDLLDGEIFLWLISRHGGNMSAKLISDRLQKHFGDQIKNGKFVCDRSTLSKRKGSALHARAKANGTEYAEEFDLFEQNESSRNPRRLRDNDNPIRKRNNKQSENANSRESREKRENSDGELVKIDDREDRGIGDENDQVISDKFGATNGFEAGCDPEVSGRTVQEAASATFLPFQESHSDNGQSVVIPEGYLAARQPTRIETALEGQYEGLCGYQNISRWNSESAQGRGEAGRGSPGMMLQQGTDVSCIDPRLL